MPESSETLWVSDESEVIKNTKLELNVLKESFKAEQELKNEIKRLWFCNWEENWENIKFNIAKVEEYLQKIKNKSWSDLDVKSSELEKWVRTIAIQVAINYINTKNWESTNNIDWIDGIRGNKTWKWVKEFQTKYKLKNKDGLPWRETINKILELLGSNVPKTNTPETQNWWISTWRTNIPATNTPETKISGINIWKINTWRILTPSGITFWRFNSWAPSRINVFNIWNNLTLNTNIDSKKYVKLLWNVKFNTIPWGINTVWNTKWRTIVAWNVTWMESADWTDFKYRLNTKTNNKWWIEWIIFKNSEVQTLLTTIVDRQWQQINTSKKLYQKKIEEEKLKESLDQDKEAVKSFEDYKHEKISQKSFEEFVLSDEWVAIVTNEIQWHIDTSHQNENGEYDKFYENYPISGANLEIKLRAAWEAKMLKDYHKEINWDDNQLSEEDRIAKEEEMEKLDVISNQITWYVDKIVWNYMISGKKNFDQDIMWELESLLSKWTHGATIDELFSDQKYKDTFKVVLWGKIKNYGMLVREGNNIDINTWDKQIDLQLKSYLYIYWRIFYSNYFTSNKNPNYYEEILPDIMRVIMSGDDVSLRDTIKHLELLELEKKLEEERKERDLQRRQEVARRNRERNNRSYGWNWWKGFNVLRSGSDDINEATWAEIVEMSGIKLNDYNPDWNLKEDFFEKWFAWKSAFWIAWNNYIKSNIDIASLLTRRDMEEIYIVEWNNIKFNEAGRNKFLLKNNITEPDDILNKIKAFPGEFSKALKFIGSWVSRQEEKMDEKAKIHALWEVIDNVRDIFDIIVEKWEWNSEFEWFKFDKNEPVKREWDDIIMSGTFNWSNIKIRYDLKSWELFINSFLQTSPWKIIIWNNTDINIKIWELDSFNTILNKHYRTPDILLNAGSPAQHAWNQAAPAQNPWANQWATPSNSSENSSNTGAGTASQPVQPAQPPVPWVTNRKKKGAERLEAIKQKYEAMLYEKIDMIGDKIMENTKKQSAINSSVTKFMKTFNIITEWQEGRTIEFSDWGSWSSDLFDFLEIINNSDPDVLDKFQLAMKEIVELSWLTWWSNNVSWPQENFKSKVTFDENNENKNISLIRDSRKDFSTKFKSLEGKQSFESGYKLWFAQIVKEKFITNGDSKPNWKLNESKMRDFFRDALLNYPF